VHFPANWMYVPWLWCLLLEFGSNWGKIVEFGVNFGFLTGALEFPVLCSMATNWAPSREIAGEVLGIFFRN